VRRSLLLLLAILLPAPAGAILVDAPDDERHTRAPDPDPGWGHVGRRGGTSAVYLGEGWVLTARHSGVGPFLLGETSHPAVPGSAVQIGALDGSGTKADLVLFRVDPAPPLPRLTLLRSPPAVGNRVILVGFGSGRGKELEFRGIPGFGWSPPHTRRWGSNRVSAQRVEVVGPSSLTRCFQMDFSRVGTEDEAQATVGDSGGAVFAKQDGEWRLAGVLLSIGTHSDQPPSSSVYGNFTNAADLSYYRRQILRTLRGHTRPAGAPVGN
jgi:hypothetical protein